MRTSESFEQVFAKHCASTVMAPNEVNKNEVVVEIVVLEQIFLGKAL